MSHRNAAALAAATLLAVGCTSRTFEAPAIRPAVTVRDSTTYRQSNKLDLLFMIDDSSSMDDMQKKLKQQLPLFMQVLGSGPGGLPDVHIAVVSSDMGAPGDTTIPGCKLHGDQGIFQAQPREACTGTTLAPGATFLSDGAGVANFTAPIEDVFQCIALLGSGGCGFENQLASVDRALGADGQGPPPAPNAGFLRDDALLAIVFLTNEDDCSAPPGTKLYSENGASENLANPLGPLSGGFRCNRYGHLCDDPATGASGIMPPLSPPADASGNPPILNLDRCVSNDTGSGLLTPVSKFIADIRALKPDPDNQILVSAIIAPPAPYAITWAPTATAGGTQELWPMVLHSCGPAGDASVNPAATDTDSDGSYGDPAVRIAQFLDGFHDSISASICAPSYASSLTAIAAKIVTKFSAPCLSGKIAQDGAGQPACTVVDQLHDLPGGAEKSLPVANCDENGNQPPCWRLTPSSDGTCAGQLLQVQESAADMSAATITRSIECSLCVPGSIDPGCA
jgi:hypothetical protein